MKHFNKVIQVEVSVDTIANNLLETMHDSFPHAVMVVEAIIGSSSNHQLGLLYNSLNGYTNDINFKVGDIIEPTNLKAYGMWTEDDITLGKASYQPITAAEIVEIDIYATDKIKVAYDVPQTNGKTAREYNWIKHTNCKAIVTPEELA